MAMSKIGVTLVLLLILAADGVSSSKLPVVGRKFTIVNQNEGFQPICPDGNPNYAAFFPNGVVKIWGNFAAAGIGVCSGSPYAVPETDVVTYEIYGDMIVFNVPGRVRTALCLMQEGNRKIALRIEQNFEVSQLQDAGPAGGTP